MSQQPVGPAQPKDSLNGGAHATPNGVSTVDGADTSASGSARPSIGAGAGAGGSVNIGTEQPSADIAATHFGLFHTQIEAQVQRLQDGCAVIDSAVGDLYSTFGKFGKIVTTVGERYGKERVLEDENQRLQAAHDVIWKHIRRDQDKHEKEKSDLRAEHQAQLKALMAQAKAGEEEKKKYEDMVKLHEEQNERARQRIEGKLRQRMKELETENAEKIAALENDKQELVLDKANLTRDLKERTRERDEEKMTRETMQTKLRADVTKLEKDLADMRAKYQVNTQSSEYYTKRYGELTDRVGRMVTEYFTGLSDGAIDVSPAEWLEAPASFKSCGVVAAFDQAAHTSSVQDPVETSKSLKRTLPILEKVPIANSPCSQDLRLAISQHVIFDAILKSVWQPFFSQYLWGKTKDRSTTLMEIYSRLGLEGAEFQHNWRVSTLRVLDRLDENTDVGRIIGDVVEARVVGPLEPLLDDAQVGSFRHDLRALLTDAFALGQEAERDQSPVHVDSTPSLMKEREGWKEYLSSSEEYEISNATDQSVASLGSEIVPEPLFVSPKIFRRIEEVGPGAKSTSSSHVELIQMGVALFPDTGIFQEAAMEWKRIRRAGTEAARSNNGGRRRASTSTTGTGLGISPRSPIKNWYGQRTQDFD